MLSKCLKCQFNLQSTDQYCLNCGLVEPTKRIGFRLSPPRFVIIAMVAGAIFFVSTNRNGIGFFYSLLMALGCGLVVELLIGGANFGELMAEGGSFNSNNLNNKRQTIVNRISDLNRRLRSLDGMIDRIVLTDGQNLQELRAKLIDAKEIIRDQLERYEMQEKRIDVVAIQNRIAPYFYNLNELSEADTIAGLDEVDRARREIAEMGRSFGDDILNDQNESGKFIKTLDETLSSCAKFREALLNHHAAEALRGISSASELISPSTSLEISHESDVFNIQAELTDFSQAFDQLESEYERLIAEREGVS